MSPHLIFLIYSLSAVSGIVALACFSVIYLQRRSELIANYLWFLLSYSLMVISSTVAVYLSVNLSSATWPLHLFISSIILGTCALTYTMPKLIFAALDKSPPKWMEDVFRLTLALCPFMIFAYVMMRDTDKAWILVAFGMIMFSASLFYSLWSAWKNKLEQQNNHTRLLKYLTRIFAVFALVVTLSENIFLSEASFSRGYLLSLPLIYFVWNIISFFTEMDKKSGSPGRDISPDFTEKHKFTRQEMIIAEQVFKGSSNKEIAQLLNISPNTVKNHVYNLFRKLGVQSRLGFIRKIREKD